MLSLLLLAAQPQPAPTLSGEVDRRHPSARETQTAIDAERAFAADAQALGQWTAFRKWAAVDATMFLPQPANARAALKDWRDPPKSVQWTPIASYVSCDGTTAANTGEWRQPDGSVGFFTTIWVRQADGGWRWVADGGDALTTPRARVAEPTVTRATCAALAPSVRQAPDPRNANGFGHSPDWTLTWSWSVRPNGARMFDVNLYDDHYRPVISDVIAAPSPKPATP